MTPGENGARPEAETIEASSGLRVTIVDVGAAIQSIRVPVSGGMIDAVLSYTDLGSCLTDPYYLGSTVGPIANRVSKAAFTLNGIDYRLDQNEPDRGNCLHGGTQGLHVQRFSLARDESRPRITCRKHLVDGYGGFPGNRSIEVAYELTDDRSLAIDFNVATDRDTIINLANHAYFNLGGRIDDHLIQVSSRTYTPVDDSLIPTGERRHVRGSVYDLRELQPLGDRRLDNNFVLENSAKEPRLAARLQSRVTGLKLDVLTTQPAIQVYTGDYLDQPFHPRQGLCLEAQGYPDAPNQPNFPSTRLAAGATYRQRTIYRFA